MRSWLVCLLGLIAVTSAAPAPFCKKDLYTSLKALADKGTGLSLLVAAIDYANLGDVIAKLEGVTVLAPNNEAMAQFIGSYKADGLASMPPWLVELTLYNHIIPGKVLAS